MHSLILMNHTTVPEPLLTSELMPYFDAIMTSEDSADSIVVQNPQASTTGHGSGMAMRKPPSLSTLAMPNLAEMPSVPQSSLYAIAALVSRLPRENRDLLYTVTELMRITASRSKETKMPLANLLLVFCPSLNMKPTLLRILCESDDVWSLPTDILDSPNPDITLSDQHLISPEESSPDSVEDTLHLDCSSLGQVGVRRALRRDPVATLYGNTTSSSSLAASSDSTSYTDDASDLSLLEASLTENRVMQNISPPLSSSMESLATPSTSSEVPSFDFDHTKNNSFTTPVIADYNQLSLHPSSHPVVSSPVPFPSTSISTPLLPSRNLSMPALDSDSGSPRTKRSNRPSLHLLFSKKSVSSLRSISSAISSPLPLPSADALTLSLPVLNTTINSSPVLLRLQDKDLPSNSGLKVAPILTQSQSTSSNMTDSPASVMYATPLGPSIPPSPRTAGPEGKEMGFIQSASRLSIEIGGDGAADDWMKSVLKAVDIDNDHSPVKEQVKSTS
jgi:RhoGAP domain